MEDERGLGMYEKDKIILQDEILDDDAVDVLEENKRE